MKPVDLNVGANQHVVLDSNASQYKSSLSFLAPKTIDDVKNWLGMPNTAFSTHAATTPSSVQPVVIAPRGVATPTVLPPVVIPVHNQYSAADIANFHVLASNYVYGHSASVSAAQVPALNAWLASLNVKIPIYVFQNINVAAGATLEVKVSALFANYITVEHTGRIQFRGGSKTVLHAAGFTGKGSTVVTPGPVRGLGNVVNG